MEHTLLLHPCLGQTPGSVFPRWTCNRDGLIPLILEFRYEFRQHVQVLLEADNYAGRLIEWFATAK